MVDLVDMFNTEAGVENCIENDEGMNALDFAQAVGLAESFLDIDNSPFYDVEELFDDDDEMHMKAEMTSLRAADNKQNIPAFERMVMKKCGLL